MLVELFNSIPHRGIAQHSSTVLLSSAIVLRSTFLVERAQAATETEEREEITPLIRPVFEGARLSR